MKNIKKKQIRICNLIVKYLSLQFCALEKHTEIINIKVKRIITFRIRKSTNRSLNSKKSHTQKKSTQMYAYVEIIKQRAVN